MIPHWAAGWWTCRSKPFCVTDCYWSRELAGTGDTWKRHCSVVSSLPGMNSLANSTLRKNWLHRYRIFSDWIFWCRLHPLILTKYSTKAIRKCKGHQGNKKEEFFLPDRRPSIFSVRSTCWWRWSVAANRIHCRLTSATHASADILYSAYEWLVTPGITNLDVNYIFSLTVFTFFTQVASCGFWL